jgi:hypothetical protein
LRANPIKLNKKNNKTKVKKRELNKKNKTKQKLNKRV